VVRILQGDCRDVLRTLPDESVHCCITSPPYFGLRNYGIPGQVWGGDPYCQHEWGDTLPGFHPGQVEQTKWKTANAAGNAGNTSSGQFCGKCGAWLGCLGLEPTPEMYVSHLVEIFREVKRTLRKDGTFWLNLGDSYWTAKGTPGGEHKWREGLNGDDKSPARRFGKRPQDGPAPEGSGLKPKDLIGIPWMVAFALRADGWWLRQDICWSKGNAMPESVTDRCTKSHEFIFLLTKSARYYFDNEAIKEPSIMRPQNRNTKRSEHPKGDEGRGLHRRPEGGTSYGFRNKRDVWTVDQNYGRLRDDLTLEQRSYALGELTRRGLL